MRKKVTLSEIAETLAFIVKRMVTKDEAVTKEEVREIVREELKETKKDVSVLKDDVSALKNKVVGTYNFLEDEARKQADLKLPRRMHDVEEKVFGRGNSKHPKHIALL